MLWPVARASGRSYLSYKRPLFILGVAGMAGLPFLLRVIMAHWSNLALFLIFYPVVIELGLTAFLASLPPAIARPLPMFFKPDLIFGDGRTLVAGVIAVALGLRIMFWEPTPILAATAGALAELRPDHRTAVRLRDVEGLSPREAAEALGIGQRAFKSRLHRGRMALRAKLDDYFAEGYRG